MDLKFKLVKGSSTVLFKTPLFARLLSSEINESYLKKLKN